MNVMYFANVIPPIPLSLREAGVYHSVERLEDNKYELQQEEQSFLEKITPGQKIHITDGGKVYVFSSIFAPADLKANIIHRWEYYNPKLEKWVVRDRLSFPIKGGRDAGYRGFSVKSNVEPGKWRVSVETERGQVMGIIKFEIQEVEDKPKLNQVIK